MHSKLFGTSGIRGIYGKEITEELAQLIAKIFVGDKIASDKNGSGKTRTLVLGRDTRESGAALVAAATAGANSCGVDVLDLGIVPTPTVALATRKQGYRGIMVTASHNPPEYNGLKLIEKTKEIGKGMEREIETEYRKVGRGLVGAGVSTTRKSATHRGTNTGDNSIITEHKALAIKMVDRERILGARPTVIVDCNGAATTITPQMMAELGCKVISLNTSLRGFERPSEPNEKNLAYLKDKVLGLGADFAVAHDGDGDRCVIFDDKGEMLAFDTQLAMMIEHELSKNEAGPGSPGRPGLVVSTVEASLTIREVVEHRGGSLEITPVGSTYVGDKMEEQGAIFGGEPCGEYIYAKGVHVPDAVVAAAKFAEIFCENGNFSKLKTQYPQNFMVRERFAAKNKLKAMEAIRNAIHVIDIRGKLRTDDGVRIDEEDGWFLVRASGTEPIIRLTMEYKTKGRLEERKKEISGLIERSTDGGKKG